MTRKAYTVTWDEELLEDLAQFWNDAPPETRTELTRACNEIDRTLGSAAKSVGRKWGDRPDQYVWSLPGYSHAIAVIYAVYDNDRIARVARLYLAKR